MHTFWDQIPISDMTGNSNKSKMFLLFSLSLTASSTSLRQTVKLLPWTHSTIIAPNLFTCVLLWKCEAIVLYDNINLLLENYQYCGILVTNGCCKVILWLSWRRRGNSKTDMKFSYPAVSHVHLETTKNVLLWVILIVYLS